MDDEIMLLTHIKLMNWKNFSSADVDCGKRVFIIGPNASGKSNFLDALRFLRDVAKDGLEKAVTARGGLKSIRYIQARQNPDINISVTIDDIWRYSLTFGSERRRSSPLVIEEIVEKYTNNGQWKKIIQRPDKNDEGDPVRLQQSALQQVNANKDFREIADFFASIQYRHILPQLVREPKSFLPGPVSNDPFGRDLVFNIWKTSEKTRQARLKRINKGLQAAVPNFKGLTVEQDTNGIPHFRVKYEHWRQHGAYQSEASFSDGTLRLVALLWSLLDTTGPLLLEEPELSLHEEIISKIPTLLNIAEKDKKTAGRQAFITTHSEALLSDPGIGVEEVLRLEPSNSGVLVQTATDEDKKLMEDGALTVADILLPKTRPANINQLRSF